LTAPSQQKNYGTRAIADYARGVAESDEGNNETRVTLGVHQ
jgi:subtilase family serine protease